jgi:tRNA pseudouridine38-40 synthase
MRIALGLQYEGSAYAGWQVQPDQPTLQGTLEKAIADFMGQDPVRVIAAGRTDTGVHALGQVIHFDSPVERDPFSWVRGLNSFLPNKMVVNWAKPVGDDFDARYSATERSYIYALHAGPCRSPSLQQRFGYYMLPPDHWFDITAMKQAAQVLVGEHDFSSFRASECQSKTPIKTVHSIEIIDEAPCLYFIIRANAFLHHMVRNIVGSLLAVAVGREDPAWLKTVLEGRNRQLAAPTFAPDGLYLAKVTYPDSFGIPAPWLNHSLLPVSVLKVI